MLIDVLRAPERLFAVEQQRSAATRNRDEYLARYGLALEHALILDVTEVARYLRAQKDPRLPHEALPNVAPLAPAMWCEYDGAAVELCSGSRYGCLLTVDYQREGWRSWKWKKVPPPPEARWILRAVYFTLDDVGLSGSDWVYFLSVGEDGQVLGMTSLPHETWIEEDYTPDPGQRHVWHEEIVVALTALCFAHCKGVTLVEHQQPRQQRRAAERKGGPPLVTYKTLNIGPVTRVLREDGNIAHTGIERALHLARGHFRHYPPGTYFGRPDAPATTIYIPLHLRGRPERGTVLKDYRVQPPGETEEQG